MTGVLKVDDIQDAGANSIVSSNGSGTLTFGSFSAPNITASTAILPDASDGAAIGSASLEWSDIFLADGAVINLGADQDVTLTHVADTGIQLNSTMKLMFNDASQYIQGASATVLDIAATDEIELTATLVDLNGNLDVSGTYTGAGLMTTGGNIVIPDAGTIGSASDTDAIAIASNGVVTLTQSLDAAGDVTGSTLNADGDTAAGDNAAIGYTAAEGLILTGQGSTDDITIKNDADTTVLNIATGASDIEISAGNLLFGTANKGVYLGVTSATAANLLDDYEEGTWTPTFRNYGGTDQNASGEYTKIGELVIAGGRIGTDGTSDSSTCEIAGLPYTISNDPAINGHGGANVNFTTGLAGHLYQTVNNTSYIQANSNVGAGMNYNDFGANKEVRFTIIYKVA